MACRVISMARGKRRTRKGPSGAERRLAQREPTVVSAVRRRVASQGEKSAPARTFCACGSMWFDSAYGYGFRFGVGKKKRDREVDKLAIFQAMRAGRTHPEDAARNRPGVIPHNNDGEDADDVQHGPCATLRVAVQLPAELSEVGDVAGPRLCDGKSCHAKQEKRSGEREERYYEEDGRVYLDRGGRSVRE